MRCSVRYGQVSLSVAGVTILCRKCNSRVLGRFIPSHGTGDPRLDNGQLRSHTWDSTRPPPSRARAGHSTSLSKHFVLRQVAKAHDGIGSFSLRTPTFQHTWLPRNTDPQPTTLVILSRAGSLPLSPAPLWHGRPEEHPQLPSTPVRRSASPCLCSVTTTQSHKALGCRANPGKNAFTSSTTTRGMIEAILLQNMEV